jgi:Na+-transporting NADH:ubiquinone oxidoreductase subunit F
MILAAGTSGTIIATVAAFLMIHLIISAVLLFVKQKLSPSGPVKLPLMEKEKLKLLLEYFYYLL